MLKMIATTNYNPKINTLKYYFQLQNSILPQHINENNREELLFLNM
jgi:hypothetical protein